MKEDVLSTKTIDFLNKATMLYKNDLILYIAYQSTRQNASQTIQRLESSNIIDSKNIDGKIAYFLTRNARQEFNLPTVDKKDFHTTDELTLSRRLEENTIKVLFSLCGIPVFEDEKLPLENVRATILGTSKDDSLNYEQANEYLKRGAYYTKKEWFKFINAVSQGKSDTCEGSRFKGVYVSKNNCYFVYIPERGDNKILKINYEKEKNLKASAQILDNFTSVYRDMPEFYTYRSSKLEPGKMIPASKVRNEPFALVISDGNAQVYSMAMGNPSGLIKGIDFSSLVDKKKIAAERRAEEEADRITNAIIGSARAKAKVKYGQVFFDAYNDIYNHMFVASRNFSGIRMIDYLCNNTLESWQNESRELFKTNPKYFIKANSPIYPYMELVQNRKVPAIYLPVYDVKMLKRIAENDFSPTIVTYEDMIETIAHSTRKQHRFYDADFYLNNTRMVASLFDRDSTFIYDYSGYTKGELILRKYLEAKGKEPINRYIYTKLPSMFGYELATEFYNSIARDEMDIKKVVAAIETKDLPEEEGTKYNIRKSVCLHVSKDIHFKLKTVAKHKKLSIQQYLMKIIYDPLMKDYKEYNDNLQKMKREWAKEK